VIALKLTDLGQAKRKAILDRRHVVLAGILGGLSPDEQAAVEKASYIILRSLAQDATSALNICRFCNERQCDDCPMEIFGALD
jgi:DNA-binding MarR family transcriptional regulator